MSVTLLFPHVGNINSYRCCIENLLNQCKKQEGSVRKIEWVTQNVHSPRLRLTFSDETSVVEGPNPPQIAGTSILWDVKNGQSTTSVTEGLCQIRHINLLSTSRFHWKSIQRVGK